MLNEEKFPYFELSWSIELDAYIQSSQIFYNEYMELQVKNFEDEIIMLCQEVLEHTTSLEKMLSFYNPSDKGKTDRFFIQLAHAIQQLRKIINPALSVGEILGLPKEASDPERPDVLVVDLEKPKWDFKPWLQEKFGNVERAYEGLLENYEMDLTTLQLAPNSGLTPMQYAVDRLRYQLKTIKIYTNAILESFESGNLTVKSISLLEED